MAMVMVMVMVMGGVCLHFVLFVVLFYILATSKVPSGLVTDSARSWRLYSAATLGDLTDGTMT